MTRYTFKKGIPFAFRWGWLPVVPAPVASPIHRTYKVRFDDLWGLPYPKNHSWQKGGGQSYDLLTNHTDSIMWVFRCFGSRVELSSYAHVNKQVVKEDDNVLRLAKGEEAYVHIWDDQKKKEYVVRMNRVGHDYVVEHRIPYTHNKRGGKTIGPWFEYPPGKIQFWVG